MTAQLGYETPIACGFASESAFGHASETQESFDLRENIICHEAQYKRVITRTSIPDAGNLPILPYAQRWLKQRAMSETPAIDVKKLKSAVIAATGPGKEFTRRSLSLRASGGKNPDLVRDLISRGQDKKVSGDVVAGLASALGKPVSEFLADASAEQSTVEVIGIVEAGVWRSSIELPEDERYSIDVPPSPIPGLIRRGMKMVGFSMDKTIKPGSDLEYFPIIENGLNPEPGDLVIAQRQNGDLFEATCKRLSVNTAGEYLLLCESTKPEFQEPLFIGKPDGNHYADIGIEIIGIVIRSHQTHFRRTT